MARYAALLRAVNVGGRKLQMTALRELMVAHGFADATTYIQSGNVVFSAGATDEAAIARKIERGIVDELGVTTRVIIRSGTELAAVLKQHPFAGAGSDPRKVFVTFLARAPEAGRVAALKVPTGEQVQFVVVGRDVFSYYPDGYGRSKVALPFFEKGLDMYGTARGWNTVVKLAELTAS